MIKKYIVNIIILYYHYYIIIIIINQKLIYLLQMWGISSVLKLTSYHIVPYRMETVTVPSFKHEHNDTFS